MTTFTRGRSAILAGAMLAALFVSAGAAQERARDRRRFMAADTKTTDDPRRTPVDPAIPRGPDGSIVLRGGRLFDGTGAAARPATLVITRNTIAAVLAPASTAWPGDARVIDVTGLVGANAQGIAQLLKIARAAALLGAHSSIAGIGSTLAGIAATLDLGMHDITTYRDLRSALADILRSAS